MASRGNPFAKFVPNPSSIPDPKTMTPTQYERYHSHDMEKLNKTLRVLKRSRWYMGGCLALLVGLGLLAEKGARDHLFGADKQGGNYLNMYTVYDEDHYAYNREFQRMFVLGETHTGDDSKHSKQLLTDLGVDLKNYGAPHIPKKAPHEKYY